MLHGNPIGRRQVVTSAAAANAARSVHRRQIKDIGFDPSNVPNPLAVEKPRSGTGAQHLMKLAMDDVSFEHKERR